MKVVIKILAFLLLFYSTAFATDTGKANNIITVRRASTEKIQKYLSDKDFKYENDYTQKTGFWDAILQWIYRHLFKPLFKNYNITTWDILEYAIAIAALILIIYFLIKSDRVGLFYKKSKSDSLNLSDTEEDIRQMNFTKLIDEAIEKGQYRVAVRYLYLKLLRDLSDRQLITWQAEKTNRDYSNELRPSALGKPFTQVTFLFDYAWYGDMPINDASFKNIRESFEQFNKQLHQQN